MLRRPNRASWHEDSARKPSPLADLLASPRPLPPPRPAEGFVGSRHDLPGMIGYGKMQQSPVQGSMFTGGRVANPQTSLAHSPEMPSFSETASHAGSGVAASLAALGLLVGTPHGGGATPTLPAGPGTSVSASTGASPAPPTQPPLSTGLRQPDYAHGPVDRTAPLDTGLKQPDYAGGPTDRTFGPDPARQPMLGTNPRMMSAALGQLLSSVGKRGVYNV